MSGAIHEALPAPPCSVAARGAAEPGSAPARPSPIWASGRCDSENGLIWSTSTRTRCCFGAAGSAPLVMSEGSSSAVYLRDYLGWERSRGRSPVPACAPDLPVLGRRRPAAGAGARRARVRVLTNGRGRSIWSWGADPGKIVVAVSRLPDAPSARTRRARGVPIPVRRHRLRAKGGVRGGGGVRRGRERKLRTSG